MPRFPTYERQQGLGGGSTASYASDGAFTAPARALAGLGNALANVGENFAAAQEKIRATQDEAWFSKARAQTTVDMIAAEREAQQSATGEAASYMNDVGGRFQSLRDQKLSEAPSPRAQQLYTQWADSFGVGVTERASRFQAESELAKRSGDFADAMNAHAQTIFADPTQYDAVYRRAMDDFEGAKQWMTPEQEAKTRGIVDRDLKLARARALPADQLLKELGPARTRNGLSVVDRIIGAESGGDPNAQNTRSSAAGLGQFIDSTWVATVRKHRPDLARGASNDQIIELKSDTALGREMTTRLTEDNAKGLAAAGIPVSDRNLYLAHFAGLAGAKKLLSADDSAPVADVMDASAIRANPEVLGGGKTVGDVKAWASGKMGREPSKPVPSVQFIDATGGKIRDKPIQGWVRDGLARAAAATDPRIAIKIVSGGQNSAADGGKRTGSTRHDHGNAADIILVVDGKEVKPSENKALYAAFFRNAAAAGFKGLGHYEWGIHIGGGAQAVWGPDRTSKTLDPEFAKAAADGWANPSKDGASEDGAADGATNFAGNPYYAGLSIDDISALRNNAERDLNQQRVEGRAALDVAISNAPVAIMNTGQYTGDIPSFEQFEAAYGPAEGAERYQKFRASVETAQQSYAMQTMPTDQIIALVRDASPTTSGDDAALAQARYEAVSKAADVTIKAREADPATYVQRVFPSVKRAWEAVSQASDPRVAVSAAEHTEAYQAAVTASISAQRQIGIADIQPLPKPIVAAAIDTFKDETKGEEERIASVSGPILAAQEPSLQKVVFDQMVSEGLPETTQGAMDALARGDSAAAQRLFQAAMVDVSALPGKAPNTPAEINEAIQTVLMDEGQVGDIYYGLSDGTAENFERAQRDAKLLSNAVNIRIRRGEALEAAVSAAAKDLYGDVKPVLSDNAQILIPSDQDETAVIEGLDGIMPQVERALVEALAVPADAPTADSTKAIFEATGKNYIANVLSEGYFRNARNGYVFIDPFTGTAIPGPDGNALIFTPDDVTAARPAAQVPMLPTDQPRTLNQNVQDEMQQQEDRVRQMYEGVP